MWRHLACFVTSDTLCNTARRSLWREGGLAVLAACGSCSLHRLCSPKASWTHAAVAAQAVYSLHLQTLDVFNQLLHLIHVFDSVSAASWSIDLINCGGCVCLVLTSPATWIYKPWGWGFLTFGSNRVRVATVKLFVEVHRGVIVRECFILTVVAHLRLSRIPWECKQRWAVCLWVCKAWWGQLAMVPWASTIFCVIHHFQLIEIRSISSILASRKYRRRLVTQHHRLSFGTLSEILLLHTKSERILLGCILDWHLVIIRIEVAHLWLASTLTDLLRRLLLNSLWRRLERRVGHVVNQAAHSTGWLQLFNRLRCLTV